MTTSQIPTDAAPASTPRSSPATSRRCTATSRTRPFATCTSTPAGRSPRRSATPPTCSTGCRPSAVQLVRGGRATTSASRDLVAGERVLDLGSGSGMDVFAAAVAVGPHGSVTGVDITPEQLAKAERLRRDEHVTFRRARIEELPFDDASFDAVISNGVVNLSADKPAVFAEAARVLRPGWTARARRHRHASARSLRAPRPSPTSGPPASPAPASGIATCTTSRPPAWSCARSAATRAYRFASERAQRTSDKYGAHTIELLAVKPTEETLAMSAPSAAGRTDREARSLDRHALPHRRGGVGRGRGGPRGPRAARRERRCREPAGRRPARSPCRRAS